MVEIFWNKFYSAALTLLIFFNSLPLRAAKKPDCLYSVFSRSGLTSNIDKIEIVEEIKPQPTAITRQAHNLKVAGSNPAPQPTHLYGYS